MFNDKNTFSVISVIGLGYIGLPTAALFASRKKHVIGVDINTQAVETINRGQIHILEPELDMVVHATVVEGYLRATEVPEPADAFLITVPTPFKGKHEPDLSFVYAAAQSIASVIKSGDLVVLESTSPVGTTEKLAEWLAFARPDLTFPQNAGENSDVRIAYCPERVLPGHILRELVENDRIIGGMTARCSEMAVSLYKLFVEGECVVTSARTAEMCKLAENSFRDVNIAFANELSMICDKLDVNVWELIKLANRHPRVNILQPGPGVGGHCIAVDPWFIVDSAPEEAKLIQMARSVNDSKPEWVLGKLGQAVEAFFHQHPEKSLKDVTIACFGLTFKPDIDDLRESPALSIVEKIAAAYTCPLYVIEPNIEELPKSLNDMAVLVDAEIALMEASIVILLVDHRSFKAMPKPSQVFQMIDTRGLWE